MAIKLKKGFVLRKIGPQYMAVPYGSMTSEIKGMVTLTESGYLLWREMEKGVDTVEALAKVLTDTYEVEEDEAVRDVNGFLDYLKELGVMEA